MTAADPAHPNAAAPHGLRRSALWGAVLPASFYSRDVLTVARALLGTVVVHDAPDGLVAGRVVETEAYAGRDDEASHAWRGERPHLRHLFGPPGTVYVYRSYGVHWCANVVTGPPAHGSAVLLRALEPIAGLPIMRRRRGAVVDRQLCNGPGKLCAALAVDRTSDGAHWTRGALTLHRGATLPDDAIATTRRIGISKAVAEPWRFTVRGSAWLSRREGSG